jgi:aminopeptidase N
LACNDVSEKFKRTPEILEFFSSIFPPYPFATEKYDHVHMNGYGMENTTCTFLNFFLDWDWGTGSWEWVIAHEIAHHWWGDWLTCGTWADVWLNEGFGTYCEVLWWENAYGSGAADAYLAEIMDTYLKNSKSFNFPIYDPPWEKLFNVITTYDKAGSVLHMLRQVLGDSAFFAGLNKYALDNANESVITDDFQYAMEEVSGQDLDWFFDEWIYGPGHPRYETGWHVSPPAYQSSAAYEIEFAVSQMQDQSENYFPFLMPLEIGIYHAGTEEIIQFTDSTGYQRFAVEKSYKPDSFVLDPHNKVLNEVVYHDGVDDVPIPGVIETPTSPSDPLTLTADGVFTYVLHVRFSNPSSELVSLALYDASGRMVRSFYQGQTKDFYRIYPLSNIPAGVYYLRLDGKAKSNTLKTVKLY